MGKMIIKVFPIKSLGVTNVANPYVGLTAFRYFT
jgi:hypothetical protein